MTRSEAGLRSIPAWLLLLVASGCGTAGRAPEYPEEKLRRLEPAAGEEYRTPLAGEGIRAEVFGSEEVIPPRDRSSVSAVDAGISVVTPKIPQGQFLPFASLYLWRRPDENTLFRGIILGVYDEILFAKSTDSLRPLEGILAFDNYTIPFAQSPYVDGEPLETQELIWGWIRPGVGLGYRRQLENPHESDNMLAVSLFFEPGFLYFDEGTSTADDFVVPQDTFEGRVHLQARLDALVRNLLELAHEGFAAGADAVYGFRSNWENWGIQGDDDASESRDFFALSGYGLAAARAPFVGSDRHHVIGYLWGGIGHGLDRFSDFRVGGGPWGEEYGAIRIPLLPGAQIEEFQTNRYVIFTGEYRWEPIFFAYLSVRGSVSYLERDRFSGGKVVTSDDVLGSIGARITTGFLLETRLQIDYDYNAGLIRNGEYGGSGIVVHIGRDF